MSAQCLESISSNDTNNKMHKDGGNGSSYQSAVRDGGLRQKALVSSLAVFV